MPITRHRITLPGVKPIQEAKPGYEYFYLYGAVEPETGQRFFTEHERLNSDCFQVFLDRFAKAFPYSHNILILDNGQFHKAKKLSVPSNVGLTFLPPYSPELNPVERLWQDPLASWRSISTSTYRACDKRPGRSSVITPTRGSLP
jgi:transposase